MTDESLTHTGPPNPSRREQKAMERLDALAKKHMQEDGMSEADAREAAMNTMRSNGRGDWRAG